MSETSGTECMKHIAGLALAKENADLKQEIAQLKEVVEKISDGFYREYMPNGEEDKREEYACVMCDKALEELK